ncbi:hypothetical protein RJ639_036071, partial [Escallonia herrerae]
QSRTVGQSRTSIKAKVKKNESHHRCIWGKGSRVRVFMYPSNI